MSWNEEINERADIIHSFSLDFPPKKARLASHTQAQSEDELSALESLIKLIGIFGSVSQPFLQ